MMGPKAAVALGNTGVMGLSWGCSKSWTPNSRQYCLEDVPWSQRPWKLIPAPKLTNIIKFTVWKTFDSWQTCRKPWIYIHIRKKKKGWNYIFFEAQKPFLCLCEPVFFPEIWIQFTSPDFLFSGLNFFSSFPDNLSFCDLLLSLLIFLDSTVFASLLFNE